MSHLKQISGCYTTLMSHWMQIGHFECCIDQCFSHQSLGTPKWLTFLLPSRSHHYLIFGNPDWLGTGEVQKCGLSKGSRTGLRNTDSDCLPKISWGQTSSSILQSASPVDLVSHNSHSMHDYHFGVVTFWEVANEFSLPDRFDTWLQLSFWETGERPDSQWTSSFCWKHWA